MEEEKLTMNGSDAKDEKNGLAIAGLICSLCGLFTCGLTSIIGLILSIVGLSKSKKMNGEGKELAIGGIIGGAIILVVELILIILITSGVIKTTNRLINFANNHANDIRNEIEQNNNKYKVDQKFVFDNFDVTIGSNYTFDTIKSSVSNENGKEVVKIPITLKNNNSVPRLFSYFYYNIYDSDNKQVDTKGSYFEDSVEYSGALAAGETRTEYIYILYEKDGKYRIDFDDISEKATVEIEIKKQ